MSEASTLLAPGTYLGELAVEGRVTPAAVEDALGMMGFQDAILESDERAGAFRFLARTPLALRVQDAPRVTWTHHHRIPEALRALEPPSMPSEAFPLERGQLYSLLLTVWLKTTGGAEAVDNALRALNGFASEKLFCVDPRVRFPERPGAEGALWYALARWEGPDSMIVDQDGVYVHGAVPHDDGDPLR